MPNYEYSDKYRHVLGRSSFFCQVNGHIISNVKCSLCQEVLIEPTQTECGCRFCYHCIIDHMRKSNDDCPNCFVKLFKEHFLYDKAIEKEIFKLQIKCLNEGCDHVCVFRDLTNHLTMCEYRQEQCEKCQETYLHDMRDQHLNRLCKKVIVMCDECGLDMTREDLEMKHRNFKIKSDDLCQKLKGLCPYKCCEDVQENIKLHLVKCSHRPIDCPLNELGCDAKIRETELSNHLQTNAMKHQMMMMTEIVRLRNENESFKRDNESMRKEMKIIKDKNAELIENLNKCKIFQNEIISNIEHIKAEIDGYKQTLGVQQESNGSEIFVTDCEGTWIIRNIRQKIQEAKSGIHTQIVSDPFYIHRPGYKMCMKIYPNGDGRGLNEYLSVYFVIINGDYDEEISWPFKQKVTLSMVNSRTNVAGIIVHMKPNNNESCYGKSTDNSNIGAGQPKFVKLSQLMNYDKYVTDGAITLKLRIDSNSLYNL